jgi:hypothetical protein
MQMIQDVASSKIIMNDSCTQGSADCQFFCPQHQEGKEGQAVAQLVEALCYKPEGRGFGFLRGNLILQPHYGFRVDLNPNRDEYQEIFWGNRRPTHKTDNLTPICEPFVYKVWEPRRLTSLWASTASHR